jgi:hypothetical protein
LALPSSASTRPSPFKDGAAAYPLELELVSVCNVVGTNELSADSELTGLEDNASEVVVSAVSVLGDGIGGYSSSVVVGDGEGEATVVASVSAELVMLTSVSGISGEDVG